MIMNKTINTLVGLLLFGFLFSACGKKGEAPINAMDKTVENVDATAWDKWVYFSFEKGKVVTVDDPTKSLEWDMAFRRNNFRVNGANGFAGKAEVSMTSSQDYEAVDRSTAQAFVGNIEATIKKTSGMGGPVVEETTFYVSSAPTHDKNTVLLYTIDRSKMMEGAAAMYPIVRNVFVFRAADGKKLYKFSMLRSVNSKGENGGTLSFKYKQI